MDDRILYDGCKVYVSDSQKWANSELAFEINGIDWQETFYIQFNKTLPNENYLIATKDGVDVQHNSKFLDLCPDAQLFLLLWGFIRHKHSSDLDADTAVFKLLTEFSHVFQSKKQFYMDLGLVFNSRASEKNLERSKNARNHLL